MLYTNKNNNLSTYRLAIDTVQKHHHIIDTWLWKCEKGIYIHKYCRFILKQSQFSRLSCHVKSDWNLVIGFTFIWTRKNSEKVFPRPENEIPINIIWLMDTCCNTQRRTCFIFLLSFKIIGNVTTYLAQQYYKK